MNIANPLAQILSVAMLFEYFDCKAEGALIRKAVETGVTSDDAAEIKSGLSEGDLIVLSAAAGLQEGMQVTPVQQ